MIVATLVILVVGAIFGVIAYLIVRRRGTVPIWAAVIIGMASMVLGSLLANVFGVGDTEGVDWLELLIQFVLTVTAVGLVAGLRSGRRDPESRGSNMSAP